MRKAYGIFTDNNTTVEYQELATGMALIRFDNGNGRKAIAILNPHSQALPYTLDGEWNLVANGESAGAEVISRNSGSVTVGGISVRIYVNDALLTK